jgi:hypothetical protein
LDPYGKKCGEKKEEKYLLAYELAHNFQFEVPPLFTELTFCDKRKRKMIKTKRPKPMYPHCQGIELDNKSPMTRGPMRDPAAKKKW